MCSFVQIPYHSPMLYFVFCFNDSILGQKMRIQERPWNLVQVLVAAKMEESSGSRLVI